MVGARWRVPAYFARVKHLLAIALAMPWVVLPIVTVLRARRSRALDEYPSDPPADGPLVSIVIPARNEARNIERCVRSALAADYPRLAVVAVDDHSTDGTGEILRRIANEDSRLRVVVPPTLPVSVVLDNVLDRGQAPPVLVHAKAHPL